MPFPPQSLQCLKLLYLVRQQREEIRLKQKQREVLESKKRKENKEQNQGESAGEKRRPRPRFQCLPTHLAYRNRKREQKVSGALWLLPFCRKMGWNYWRRASAVPSSSIERDEFLMRI